MPASEEDVAQLLRDAVALKSPVPSLTLRLLGSVDEFVTWLRNSTGRDWYEEGPPAPGTACWRIPRAEPAPSPSWRKAGARLAIAPVLFMPRRPGGPRHTLWRDGRWKVDAEGEGGEGDAFPYPEATVFEACPLPAGRTEIVVTCADKIFAPYLDRLLGKLADTCPEVRSSVTQWGKPGRRARPP